MPRNHHPCFIRGATDGMGRRIVQFDSDGKTYAFTGVTDTDWASLSASIEKGEDFNYLYRPFWSVYVLLTGWPLGLAPEWTCPV